MTFLISALTFIRTLTYRLSTLETRGWTQRNVVESAATAQIFVPLIPRNPNRTGYEHTLATVNFLSCSDIYLDALEWTNIYYTFITQTILLVFKKPNINDTEPMSKLSNKRLSFVVGLFIYFRVHTSFIRIARMYNKIFLSALADILLKSFFLPFF